MNSVKIKKLKYYYWFLLIYFFFFTFILGTTCPAGFTLRITQAKSPTSGYWSRGFYQHGRIPAFFSRRPESHSLQWEIKKNLCFQVWSANSRKVNCVTWSCTSTCVHGKVTLCYVNEACTIMVFGNTHHEPAAQLTSRWFQDSVFFLRM